MKTAIATDRNTGHDAARWLGAGAVLLVLSAPGCSTMSGTAAVSQARDEWLQNFRAKNVDAAVAFYSDDAAFLPPDGGAIVGKEAIRDLYRTVATTYDSDLALNSRRTEASGKLAYDSGDFVETLTTISNSAVQKYSGQYLMEFRRDAQGKWRITEHVWTAVPPAHP
jgi:ketosteroid isomerase-like protein